MQTEGDWNPSDYAYHLTRRVRGLPFWFSLAVHGTDAYAAAVERTLAIAKHAADRIDQARHAELVTEPELTVVLWRRTGWGAADYHDWSRRILVDQRAFVVPTLWHGETVARAVFLHPECPPTVIEDVLASME
jgi:glutamate/tyrosine decarboxylase-like PLP-dependent enzyme